jgi:hypothetical protein
VGLPSITPAWRPALARYIPSKLVVTPFTERNPRRNDPHEQDRDDQRLGANTGRDAKVALSMTFPSIPSTVL